VQMIWHQYIGKSTQVTGIILAMHSVDYDSAGT
jgi:hypothetical protein